MPRFGTPRYSGMFDYVATHYLHPTMRTPFMTGARALSWLPYVKWALEKKWEGTKQAMSDRQRLAHIYDRGFDSFRNGGPPNTPTNPERPQLPYPTPPRDAPPGLLPGPPPRRALPPPTRSKMNAMNSSQDHSISKFTYKPRPHPKKFGKFDTLNCDHGSIDFRDYIQRSSQVGQKLLFVGHQRNSWSTVYNMRNTFLARISQTAIADGPTAPVADTDRRLIEHVWMKCTSQIVNRNTLGCWVTIYDVISIRTGNTDGGQFVNEMQSIYAQRLEEANDLRGASSTDVESIPMVIESGTEPYALIVPPEYDWTRGKNFHRFFKICSKKRYFLSPGEVHQHTTFHRKNHVMTSIFGTTAVPDDYWRNVYTSTIFEVQGGVGHVLSGGNTNVPTIQGVNIDYVAMTRNYIRHLIPYGTYFTFKAVGSWPDTGADRSTVGQVEEGTPTTTVGQ